MLYLIVVESTHTVFDQSSGNAWYPCNHELFFLAHVCSHKLFLLQHPISQFWSKCSSPKKSSLKSEDMGMFLNKSISLTLISKFSTLNLKEFQSTDYAFKTVWCLLLGLLPVGTKTFRLHEWFHCIKKEKNIFLCQDNSWHFSFQDNAIIYKYWCALYQLVLAMSD